VRALDLSDNGLVGRLPTALGDLIHLTQLRLQNNLLTNVLPQSLTNLTQLTTFHFDSTLLCEPAESTVQAWLAGIADLQRTGIACNLIHFPVIVR
jgi:Leucine-rich repeat (LRR) protein